MSKKLKSSLAALLAAILVTASLQPISTVIAATGSGKIPTTNKDIIPMRLWKKKWKKYMIKVFLVSKF